MNPSMSAAAMARNSGAVVTGFVDERFAGLAMRAVVQSWNARGLALARRMGFVAVGGLSVVRTIVRSITWCCGGRWLDRSI